VLVDELASAIAHEYEVVNRFLNKARWETAINQR